MASMMILTKEQQLLAGRLRLCSNQHEQLLLIEESLAAGHISEDDASQLIDDLQELQQGWERTLERASVSPPMPHDNDPIITIRPYAMEEQPSYTRLTAAVEREIHELVWKSPRMVITDPNWGPLPPPDDEEERRVA